MLKTTNDESVIRAWAARTNARPVEYVPTSPDSEPAHLGFVFGDPNIPHDQLEPISWEKFFALFHLLGLVLAFNGGQEYELLKIEGGPSGRFEGKPTQA